MNENAVTAKVIKLLNSIDKCYARKRHGGIFSSGDPDIHACYKGRTVLIEMKLDGGTLSKLQAFQMSQWKKAGALVLLAVYDRCTKVMGLTSVKSDAQYNAKISTVNAIIIMQKNDTANWNKVLSTICEITNSQEHV
jgi:hypothetical protein